MLTAAVESDLGKIVHQYGGPALGVFQMEPMTEEDIHKHYLSRNQYLASVVSNYMTDERGELEWNLAYQILMARIHYRRFVRDLPEPDDVEGLAEVWKMYYNTPKGKGTIKKAIESYQVYAL